MIDVDVLQRVSYVLYLSETYPCTMYMPHVSGDEKYVNNCPNG